MKRINNLIFVILIILISNGVVYSQVGYWEPTAKIETPYKSVYGLSVSNNGNIWATTHEGIFYSTNNGDTWIQTTNSGLNGIGIMAFAMEHPISGSIFLCGYQISEDINNGIFRLSSKDGKFWEKVLDLPRTNIFNDFQILDMVVTISGDIYAVGEGHNDCSGSVYYSRDNGDTWIEKNKGLPPMSVNPPWLFMGFRSLTLANDGTLYAAGRSGVYRLDDGVDTWIKISEMDVTDYCFC